MSLPDFLCGPEGLPERQGRWTLAEAQRWLRLHAEAAQALGWSLSLCGSTILEGDGRDLDVIAVPIAADAVDLPALWKDEGQWAEIHSESVSRTGVIGAVFEYPDGTEGEDEEGEQFDWSGKLVDVTFLPRRVSPTT
jgi:hypothetical protein